MEAFIFALEAVVPIILTVAIGYLLKKVGIIKSELASSFNRLVFRVFLPSMLFLNVYKIESLKTVDFGYILYVFAAVFLVFLISIPMVCLITKQQNRRGVLLQATFRSNFALIGIPVSTALFGAEGAAVATLLSAAIIPVYNILGVVSLSLFSEDRKKPNAKNILLEIIKNPLIQSIAVGLICLLVRTFLVKENIDFRLSDIKPIFKVFEYLSQVATPLALITLGAQFEFSAIRELRHEIIFGTFVRILAVPLISISIAYILKNNFSGAHFAAFVAVFATPVAVSTVPMAEAMNGDSALAGQLVVWTTLLSSLSVFIASYLLKLAGIF